MEERREQPRVQRIADAGPRIRMDQARATHQHVERRDAVRRTTTVFAADRTTTDRRERNRARRRSRRPRRASDRMRGRSPGTSPCAVAIRRDTSPRSGVSVMPQLAAARWTAAAAPAVRWSLPAATAALNALSDCLAPSRAPRGRSRRPARRRAAIASRSLRELVVGLQNAKRERRDHVVARDRSDLVDRQIDGRRRRETAAYVSTASATASPTLAAWNDKPRRCAAPKPSAVYCQTRRRSPTPTLPQSAAYAFTMSRTSR